MLPPGETFFKCLNQKLPKCSALTANNAFAQKRLQKEGIYCLHTKHINLCGGIDVVAFDKVRQSFYRFYWDKLRQIVVLVIGKLEEAMTMIVLVTRSTSLGWSDNWISQPPWVSDQGWSFRLNGKRQKYHPRSILSPGNIYEVIKMEYNKISYVKIVKYGEAGIIDNWLYLSFHGFRYDLYTGNRWKLWKGFIFCSFNDTEAIFFLKWIQH